VAPILSSDADESTAAGLRPQAIQKTLRTQKQPLTKGA